MFCHKFFNLNTYAIIDEYTAKATYEAIITTYSDIRPFTNIVNAEQTHSDLLLPLFETYQINGIVNDDVRLVFEQLMEAFEHHLHAFKTDRYVGVGYDLAKRYRRMFGGSNKQAHQSHSGVMVLATSIN